MGGGGSKGALVSFFRLPPAEDVEADPLVSHAEEGGVWLVEIHFSVRMARAIWKV